MEFKYSMKKNYMKNVIINEKSLKSREKNEGQKSKMQKSLKKSYNMDLNGHN